MTITYPFWVQLSIKVLGAVLNAASPFLRDLLSTYLNDLYKKAKESPNPMDDFFVRLIAELVSVELKD